MSRYFLAIELPESLQESLSLIRPPQGPGIKLVAPRQMHITLHFLGELSTNQVESLTTSLSVFEVEPFPLTVSGLGTFPTRKSPRVLWAGLKESSELLDLHHGLGELLKYTLEFEPEDRPYHPHITLARLKTQADPAVVEAHRREHSELKLSSFTVTCVTLFESSMGSSGYEYRAVVTSRFHHHLCFSDHGAYTERCDMISRCSPKVTRRVDESAIRS